MRRTIYTSVVATLVALIGAATYIASAAYRAEAIYAYLKNPAVRSQTAGLFREDPHLGYAPVPGATGAYLFPEQMTVPIRFDEEGFRVPMNYQRRALGRPGVLALGCSFTFGDGSPAEGTFAWLIGASLNHGAVLNAGVSGYGLAQMLLLAERDIPRYKPKLVLVQYSPWLIDRAISRQAPSAFGTVPTPYVEDRDPVRIHDPEFMTLIFSVPFFSYRQGPAGFPDRASFVARAAVPYFVRTDVRTIAAGVRRAAGALPAAMVDRVRLVRALYQRIGELCRQHGAEMVVVGLAGGVGHPPPEIAAVLRTLPGRFVDADDYLEEQLTHLALPATPAAYQQAYAVRVGVPPRIVDPHPNMLANRYIAEAVLNALAAGEGHRESR